MEQNDTNHACILEQVSYLSKLLIISRIWLDEGLSSKEICHRYQDELKAEQAVSRVALTIPPVFFEPLVEFATNVRHLSLSDYVFNVSVGRHDDDEPSVIELICIEMIGQTKLRRPVYTFSDSLRWLDRSELSLLGDSKPFVASDYEPLIKTIRAIAKLDQGYEYLEQLLERKASHSQDLLLRFPDVLELDPGDVAVQGHAL